MGNAQTLGARAEQQDAFGFSDKDDDGFVRHGGVLAVVADGMGGHAHGGNASRIAVQTFLHEYMAKPVHRPIIDALHQAFVSANAAVCAFAEAVGELDNCGTTLLAAVVHPESHSLNWIGAGDSRLYLIRDHQWIQLTTDATYANVLLNQQIKGMGLGNEWQRDGPLRALTSFLGVPETGDIDCSLRGFKLHAGDWLVLCTDGVYNTLDPAECLACLTGEPQRACENLILAVSAKHQSHQDNATVAVIACNFTPDPSYMKRRRAFLAKLSLGLLMTVAAFSAF